MRRRWAVLLSTVSLLLPLTAACGGGGGAVDGVKVTGSFGQRPDVTFPKGAPKSAFTAHTTISGSGTKVADGDLVIADYVGYVWNGATNRLLGTSFTSNSPSAFPSWSLVPGLRKALIGARTGSRVVAVIPPADGYGTSGDPNLQISGSDTLLYVLDVVASVPKTATAKGIPQPLNDPSLPQVSTTVAPGQAPAVSIPHGAPPSTLQFRTLIKGPGNNQVKQGQTIAVQETGYIWRTGQPFDSSYTDGHVFGTVIGVGQVMKGWDSSLVGQTVGSRVLVVVPPSLGYGALGLKQSGIRSDDTLVFVIDIVGAY